MISLIRLELFATRMTTIWRWHQEHDKFVFLFFVSLAQRESLIVTHYRTPKLYGLINIHKPNLCPPGLLYPFTLIPPNGWPSFWLFGQIADYSPRFTVSNSIESLSRKFMAKRFLKILTLSPSTLHPCIPIPISQAIHLMCLFLQNNHIHLDFTDEFRLLISSCLQSWFLRFRNASGAGVCWRFIMRITRCFCGLTELCLFDRQYTAIKDCVN